MILFNNGYFTLDYDPTTDTLFVDLPEMRTQELSEAKHCFDIMVEHVNNYHVHYLLLDSRKAVVQVDNAAYHQLIYQVSQKLKYTHLKKVARLASSDSTLEGMANKVQQHVLKSEPASYLIQNFTSREQALEWLTGKPFRSFG
ncbi:hypothetical protein HUW51_05710 [Adhaeribacter swui]|uniref:STAS/SEC14 domain-containing protein n=1 Tax=Adhaeribacter swui TaxID=2086471 RepID=A0A7G7G517_9BACT|nr:hypothetical protein [Adhaeribacter swui]QNF32251.1 hypothetical protein HUW51_05710 [Adhaeribacter swui]